MHAEETRVLVVAPLGQDAEAIATMLRREGIVAKACAGVGECLADLEGGVGAVLLTEEALELPGAEELLNSFGRQPAWSELPLLILTSGGESRFERLLEIAADVAGSVTLLERPMRVGTLLHSVQVALRSRRRQYEVRNLLVERERREAVLREHERRQGYLLKLSDALRGVGDAVEAQEQAARLLGEELRAERVVYFEVVAEDYVAERDYAHGVSHLRGNFPIASFGLSLVQAYQAGETVVAPDVKKDARLSLPERARYAAIQIGAHVGVPLVKEGRLVAGLGVHARQARAWSAAEVELVEETADRTWAAVERARAETALRESELRLRRFFDSEMMGAIYWNMDGQISGANDKFLRMVGYSRQELMSGRVKWSQMTPDEYLARDEYALNELRTKGVDTPYEKEYICKDGTRIPILIGAAMLDANRHEGVAFVLDITERKRAEEALQKSEERFKLAMEGAGVGLWDWDIPTGRVYYSPRWKALFGYDEKDIGEGVEDWVRLLHPEDREAVCKFQEDFLAGTGKTVSAEYRLRHKDGSYRWIEASAVVLRDEKGQACRLVGSHGDITARKQAEAAVREREERLRTIMDAAQVAILVAHDPECRRITGNAMGHAILGVPLEGNLSATPGDAPGRVAWRAMSGGRELAAEELPIQRAARTGETIRDLELEILRATGDRVAIMATAAPLRDAAGAITGAVGTLLDITERKRAEEALRQANERLSFHVQNTPLAVVEFDADLKVCAWGAGAERIFGWKAEEVVGRPMWEIPWICEEDRAKVEQVSAGLETGRTPRSVSPNRNLRKDGQVIWCEWYNSSLADGSGKMQSILTLILDVTKRQEAEAVLARDKQQLERLVTERTAELRELVGELEHFSYSITHDMRAPLRAMMGFAEVAKELSSEGPQQEQKMFLDRIQTAAKRMDLLITDALNYSKAVRSELPLAPVDVARLLRGMVDTYPELQIAQEGIRIEPELPSVMGNEAGLTQCFSNLLINAVKFTRLGETPQIRVWAEVLHSQPSTPNSQPQDWVRIWVEDRGVGIGPKMLPRVFDMFARGTSAQAGTGIGLALVRKVVQRMGGRVGVESEEGCGSRFWVELKSGEVIRRAAAGAVAPENGGS